MLGARTRFWIVLALLLGGHAPAFATIGLGLHLAGDDHQQERRAFELALAAAHGHHHSLDAAPHEHSAVRMAGPTAPLPENASLAGAPSFPSPPATPADAQPGGPPPRGGAPEFFYRYRSLRL